ncbi:MAG: ABC transporter permease, partial [Patescibacteria group bacterium]|nr:ABC transporter permease [Patescibacteria group bacterium]
MLAKTDFKLRYQGSFLGYIWAVLQPLLLFLVLNFVFSGVFGGGGNGV